MRQNPKAPAVQVLFALLGLLLVVGAYVLVMHLTVHSTEVRAAYTADQRDATYAVLHLVFVAGTVVVGFLLGKWLNGQGVAYAALFFLVMATSMVFLQLGSQTLACHRHNDIIVHWTC
ncbi:MAG TPA: hypothetical protein VIK11_05220 [Tepidiformaceae bacterium]